MGNCQLQNRYYLFFIWILINGWVGVGKESPCSEESARWTRMASESKASKKKGTPPEGNKARGPGLSLRGDKYSGMAGFQGWRTGGSRGPGVRSSFRNVLEPSAPQLELSAPGILNSVL
jgi:hypothetical protein